MAFNLKGRHLLTLRDYTSYEIEYLIDLSAKLKADKRAGIFSDNLARKNIALIFEKPSTRTRCAFTVACIDEGAHPEYLGKNDIQLGKKESVADTARVLGRFFDGIEFRGFSQEVVEGLAKYAGVPVWNGLTDQFHPTQILADLLTVKEKFGYLKGLKMVYCGDGRNNMANSLMIGCAKMGMHFVIAAPKDLWPEESLVSEMKIVAEATGASIELSDNAIAAVRGADIIYTDVWVSMGEEDKPGITERIDSLRPFQVNGALMKATGKRETIFMHCLPAHHTDSIHDMEVTEEVFESPNSVVFDEAENRMHTIKAVMVATIGK
ncbi:MAG: ornithine carbamoyltransferase [Candidatus Wallbacteria bacterium HGW-Wallbacteria-1]|jgi:ornithine carbamoyltransferase|uniref:Ornithine carbamoyltransferase n=1 Tax=Candidatus Wallbacteria bacterium HGW-Wallbacteria-1 TaxID=2013854 RepID=A0A2N1PM17_9BACT|nr:MAG: ornithine carbamoyltransferase [Candidatus Wallbacteria bacterium HGW-Wallbacteria-1]